jgi:UDP-perosamine 4-acetyltransferase
MDRVVIIGAGGHAKVVIELLEEDGRYELAGCTSQGGPGQVLGLNVLGDDSILPSLYAGGVRHAFVAVGNNRARYDLIRHLRADGFHLVNAISRHAVISPRVRLGEGIAIMAGAVINAASDIGDGAVVNTGATVDHDCRIGECAHIAPGCTLAGCVTVGEGTFLGAGCRVIPNVLIGAWATVGAGAAVIRDIPEHTTAVGVPARVMRAQNPIR